MATAIWRLPQPIPAGNQFQSRATLAAQFARGSNPVLPSDSVALGILAMRNGSVSWFDPSLLRHPLQVPALIRTARASNKAFAELLRCRNLCGVGLAGLDG